MCSPELNVNIYSPCSHSTDGVLTRSNFIYRDVYITTLHIRAFNTYISRGSIGKNLH
jgi:hypothetical protein